MSIELRIAIDLYHHFPDGPKMMFEAIGPEFISTKGTFGVKPVAAYQLKDSKGVFFGMPIVVDSRGNQVAVDETNLVLSSSDESVIAVTLDNSDQNAGPRVRVEAVGPLGVAQVMGQLTLPDNTVIKGVKDVQVIGGDAVSMNFPETGTEFDLTIPQP